MQRPLDVRFGAAESDIGQSMDAHEASIPTLNTYYKSVACLIRIQRPLNLKLEMAPDYKVPL